MAEDSSGASLACRGLKLPVVRRVHLQPYENFLRGIGAPVERYLERAKLPIRPEPAAEYMSNRGYFEFVGISAHEQGIPDLGYRACMPVGRARLSEELLRLIERSPTLYRALKEFVVGMIWFGYPKVTPEQGRKPLDDVLVDLP
jgi:hypothetical protein